MTVPLLKFDVRRCTRETLEIFATAFLCGCGSEFRGSTPEERRLISEARVRTRPELDAELGRRLRGSPCILKTRVGTGRLGVDPPNAVSIDLAEPQAFIDLVLASATAPEEP